MNLHLTYDFCISAQRKEKLEELELKKMEPCTGVCKPDELVEAPMVWKKSMKHTLATVLADKVKEAKREVRALHKTIASRKHDVCWIEISDVKEKLPPNSALYEEELDVQDAVEDESKQLVEIESTKAQDEDEGEDKTS